MVKNLCVMSNILYGRILIRFTFGTLPKHDYGQKRLNLRLFDYVKLKRRIRDRLLHNPPNHFQLIIIFPKSQEKIFYVVITICFHLCFLIDFFKINAIFKI